MITQTTRLPEWTDEMRAQDKSGESQAQTGIEWRSGDAIDLAERWESSLGDPDLPENSISFAAGLAVDETEELPTNGIDILRALGFPTHFVPARLGGKLVAADEILMLGRVVARRDMSVAVSESTQLWMMLAWIAGNAEQQEKGAAAVLAGGVVPCLAYSEAAHGADLSANEFLAIADSGRYILKGEKWPINRGRTSTHVVLLGRTGSESTPPQRQLSLFLVNRSDVDSEKVHGLPSITTYGLRGCDISGVKFDDVLVPETMRLGDEGEGLELALRGLLITRTFCTGLSLGAGDTMLRQVASYLSERTLYTGPASEIPFVSESLANSYLSLLLAECQSLVAMRGLHLYTEEFSIWANVSKVQVARFIDFSGKVLARALGARYYMRATEHVGTFQKMLRDSSVVSLFDGSEPVCLDSIALQLPAMAKARRLVRDDDWRFLYDLEAPLPPLEPERVTVFGRGRDATFASLPALASLLDSLSSSAGCSDERIAALRVQVSRLRETTDDLFLQLGDFRQWSAAQADISSASNKSTSTRLLHLAEEVCSLHAKIAALGTWLYNRDQIGGFFAEGEWLQAALSRRLTHQFEIGDLEPGTAHRLTAEMHQQRVNGEFFSIRRMRQAKAGSVEVRPEFS